MHRIALKLCYVFLLASPAPLVEAQTASGTEQAIPNDTPEQLFEPRTATVKLESGESKQLNYRLLKPLDFDPAEKYPLVIFLHGAGERGDDNTVQLVHGMADFCKPEHRKAYPCYVLAPQCPKGEKWADVDWSKETLTFPKSAAPSTQVVLSVVDEMVSDAAVDPKRIYITGLSMGGYGTWDVIARRPNFFAAAVPICGGADLSTAGKIKHMPIWCFHGGADNVVSVDLSRKMIAALKEAGGEPKYTEYEGVGHDSWTATYANPDVFAWLFSQRLPAKPATPAPETK